MLAHHRCQLGYVLLAATVEGVSAVALDDDPDTLKRSYELRRPTVELRPADDATDASTWCRQLCAYLDGHGPLPTPPLALACTPYRARVYQRLLAIPRGEVRTYQQLADELDQPSGARAVASACAANPLAILIPCHRVLRSDGQLAGYRWGVARKRALLAFEQRLA